MRADATSPLVRGRRRTSPARRLLRASASFALLLLCAGLLGLVFAGSPAKLAAGVRIAGVNVGGLTQVEARQLLERRAAALAETPVTFTAGSQSFQLRPSQLSLIVDWRAAVATASREGGGFGPVRGFRRLRARFFGAEVTPPARAWEPALDYKVSLLAKAIDRPHREAALKLRGLQPAIVPGQTGRVLDLAAAARLIVGALASFERVPVALPVRDDPPNVTATTLAPVAAQVRTALSAPVQLALGETRWRLSRRRIAALIALPQEGSRTLRIGGPGADAYFERLDRRVDRPPTDADFAIGPQNAVRIIPAKDGLAVDVPATARALLAAALSPIDRVAQLFVEQTAPKRTTADAQAMGITGLAASYETIYGGIANRIHNVQLVAQLLDKHLIRPGETFSFNGATGERTAAKGFREAPVIINGELQTALGGGVCQVSTTVFNAAYEAGLNITTRTNHALYISHYPLGRDATVNYPDVDLRFVNDTGHWLLLRTFVGPSSLTIALYGTPTHRKVVSETSPLVAVRRAPVRKTTDPTLPPGARVVDDPGAPARVTSVRRRVYDANGKLLYDNVWHSSYRGEVKVVRIGPKRNLRPD